MKLNRILIIVFAAAFLMLTAGCLGVAQTGNSDDTAETNSTISVSTSGEVTAEPDLAVVRLGVSVTEETADAARQNAAENVNRMRNALSEMGVEDEQVRTVSYDLQTVYNRSIEGRQTVVGYRVTHTFEVESDVDSAGEVVDTAVENGANRVESVRFTLKKETRKEFRQKALELSMDNALEDASVIANSSELSITGVKSASTSNFEFSPFESFDGGRLGDASSTVIEPGPVTVSATVHVVYRAE